MGETFTFLSQIGFFDVILPYLSYQVLCVWLLASYVGNIPQRDKKRNKVLGVGIVLVLLIPFLINAISGLISIMNEVWSKFFMLITMILLAIAIYFTKKGK